MRVIADLVFIGEAPGPNTHPDYPLYPFPARSAGYYLWKLTGIPRWLYVKHRRANLLYEHPGTWSGRKRKQDKWPTKEARVAAMAARPHLRGKRVVLVGRRVATAFGLGSMLWFVWTPPCPRLGIRYCVIPHTSGRNHWYNEQENVDRAKAFFEQLFRPAVAADHEHDKKGVVFLDARRHDHAHDHALTGGVPE